MKLSNVEKCVCCNQGLMHGANLNWHKLEITHEMADLRAIQRAHGMEQMMGGDIALARVMGVDERVSAEVSKAMVYICFDCHIKYSLAVIIDHIPDDKWQEGEDARNARLRMEGGQ